MPPAAPPANGPANAATLPPGAKVLGWLGIVVGAWRVVYTVLLLAVEPGAARLGGPAVALSIAIGLFCAAWAIAGAGLLLRREWGRKLYTALAYAPAVVLALYVVTHLVCRVTGYRRLAAYLPWQWGLVLVVALLASALWGTPGRTSFGLANFLRSPEIRRAMRN